MYGNNKGYNSGGYPDEYGNQYSQSYGNQCSNSQYGNQQSASYGNQYNNPQYGNQYSESCGNQYTDSQYGNQYSESYGNQYTDSQYGSGDHYGAGSYGGHESGLTACSPNSPELLPTPRRPECGSPIPRRNNSPEVEVMIPPADVVDTGKRMDRYRSVSPGRRNALVGINQPTQHGHHE